MSVTVLGDKTVEGNEDFYLNVTPISGASIADGLGMATILEDDRKGRQQKSSTALLDFIRIAPDSSDREEPDRPSRRRS